MFKSEHFVRRGPGRTKAEVTKEKTSVRLDPDVLARWREGGPGWQSQIKTGLRKAPGPVGARVSFPQPRANARCRRIIVRARSRRAG